MIAALQMYDAPGQRAANDRLWELIREALPFETPPALTRDRDMWDVWRDPELLLSQTCGLPYRARLQDQVTLIGAPDHRIEGVAPGHYQSVIVARDAIRDMTFDGLRLAVNDSLSQSGWAVVAETKAVPAILTGSHAASAQAVLRGDADIAALDASTWRHISQADPTLDALTVVHTTPPGPTLPFITARPELREPLFDALSAAFEALHPEDAEALGMYGVTAMQPQDYLHLPIPAPPAIS